jgi:hypothetical protein
MIFPAYEFSTIRVACGVQMAESFVHDQKWPYKDLRGDLTFEVFRIRLEV